MVVFAKINVTCFLGPSNNEDGIMNFDYKTLHKFFALDNNFLCLCFRLQVHFDSLMVLNEIVKIVEVLWIGTSLFLSYSCKSNAEGNVAFEFFLLIQDMPFHF